MDAELGVRSVGDLIKITFEGLVVKLMPPAPDDARAGWGRARWRHPHAPH